MGKLEAALHWASRGFPVFPVVRNGKAPAHGTSWPDISTTDPDTIRAMWTDPVLKNEIDYNIGVNCTDMVVVDVDTKFGKDGHNQYVALGGNYDTLVVQSPSGGYHCYFTGPDSSNAPIAKDVDIRSHRGYVLAPGSVLEDIPGEQVGGEYKLIVDQIPAWVPFDVERHLRAPYERKQGEQAVIESDASVNAAKLFLETTPVAVEGQRGDETTFTTAAKLVREYALYGETAFELMRDIWNPKCEPPWELDELYRKVENAVQYGTADMGRLDPSVLFATVPEPELPPTVFEQSASVFGNAIDALQLPPRPWMIDRMLMLHELTLLLAPGSAGKSSVSLAVAAHLAVGKDFGPYSVKCACKSIVYNGEDDLAEQSRRLYAVCSSYNLDYQTVKASVMLLSADSVELKLVTNAGRVPVVNTTVVDQLVDLASDPSIGLIVYDPLVDIHDADETDNPQMNSVMRTLKSISTRANVASLVLHHTTKAGSTRQEDRVGNMDIARGASGTVYKARIAFTLLNASTQDAEDYGMQDGERHTWVRLDDAKMNMALANDKAVWFKKEGVKIPSGDVVGCLHYCNLSKNTNNIRARISDVLTSTMLANGVGSMPMLQAVATLKANEPLWANKTDAQVKQKLEGMFATPVEFQGHTLQVKRETEGSRNTVAVVLT